MQTIKTRKRSKLPGRFEDLVALLPPRAIDDDVQLENMIEMIDHLMASGKLTKGQESYMETLVQLVEAYERKHHAIDVSDISGLDTLRFLLDENGMNASDLARLLGVHASLGSKILNGDRGLTLKHVRKLAQHFKLDPSAFIE
jgi:HTH-type transcriptional regulator / antitoxin HigA